MRRRRGRDGDGTTLVLGSAEAFQTYVSSCTLSIAGPSESGLCLDERRPRDRDRDTPALIPRLSCAKLDLPSPQRELCRTVLYSTVRMSEAAFAVRRSKVPEMYRMVIAVYSGHVWQCQYCTVSARGKKTEDGPVSVRIVRVPTNLSNRGSRGSRSCVATDRARARAK